jgi:hypothetical protein
MQVKNSSSWRSTAIILCDAANNIQTEIARKVRFPKNKYLQQQVILKGSNNSESKKTSFCSDTCSVTGFFSGAAGKDVLN